MMTIRRLWTRAKAALAWRGERGISLPELTVTLALMSVVGLLFYDLYIGTVRTTMFLESNNDLAVFGQQAINSIKLETMQSRGVMQNDAYGNSYVAKLGIPSAVAAISETRLPTANANGIFEPDEGSEVFTGNSILQAKQVDAFLANVDHDGTSGTANIDYLADRYRFQYFYLAEKGDHPIHPLDHRLELMHFESEEYADWFQLNSLPATFRTAVVGALYDEGLRFAWNPGAVATSAFYQINDNGSLTGPVTHTIAASAIEPVMPGMGQGRISGAMNYSVGITADPPFQTIDPVSVFGIASGSFPSGFEVQMIGPTGARKINIRLMLMAQYQKRLNSHANSVTVTVAEF
ncbi:MAG: hypothetical protein HC882_01695 [Acidobacteria bacterium]|nr:hypothetical protein [Acidobacteriota bacterium]